MSKRSSKEKIILEEINYYEVVSNALSDNVGLFILRTTDVINGKTSGLLTHISIMIAILSVFIVEYGEFHKVNLFTCLVAAEILLYLIFAIGCLFGLFLTSPSTFSGCEDKVKENMVIITRRRRRIYLVSLKGTIIITIAFVVTLIEKILFNL